jgi:Metal-dependent hydrolases of the beta-lactamase superfamily III
MSGDTAPSEKLIEMAKGSDILVHDVYSNLVLTEDQTFGKIIIQSIILQQMNLPRLPILQSQNYYY